MQITISRKFMIGFSFALVILAANIFISKNALLKQFDAADAVTASLRMIDVLKNIQSSMANLEITLRGYIVSGDEDYLMRSHLTLSATRETVAQLQTLAVGNAEAERAAAELENLIGERLTTISDLVDLHVTQGASAAIKAISISRSGAATDRTYRLIGRMSEAEDKRLAERTKQLRQNTSLSVITFYVAAGFNLALLCFVYYLAYREIKERQQAEDMLRHTATHDPLTALPNRALLSERLTRRLTSRQRQHEHLAVLSIDLDRFKNINDTLGHDAGDRLLQGVSRRLSGCVRRGDTVSRQGGDEFVVLIEHFDSTRDIVSIAEKILAEVAKPLYLNGKEFHITASIGVSTYPDDGRDLQTLLKNADVAMYRAKEQGKNNYKFYAKQMNLHSVEQLAMESDLRRAMERGELMLFYQPKVDTRTGRLTGMEALLRWQHPEIGLISPSQCIPLAEETGLILSIGEWVLKTACAQNRRWQEQGLPRLRVAVNLSARQFADTTLVSRVERVLLETGLDPCWLELEITESMVMLDPERAVQTMHDLKTMQISLAIDDFGSGYSSLAYLKRFPIDSLKIDRSFIQDLPDDADSAAITQTIIAMAHSMRLKVIGEGVENDRQATYLREQHCDEVQGFRFGAPVPEAQFTELLRDRQAKQSGKLSLASSRRLSRS